MRFVASCESALIELCPRLATCAVLYIDAVSHSAQAARKMLANNPTDRSVLKSEAELNGDVSSDAHSQLAAAQPGQMQVSIPGARSLSR